MGVAGEMGARQRTGTSVMNSRITSLARASSEVERLMKAAADNRHEHRDATSLGDMCS
jgi:hypothetical protein